jgi:hypothetical protein
MNEVEKLRVLIPHWIEHNEEHAGEFQRWADQVDEVAVDIRAAANAMTVVNELLAEALDKLGGPIHSSQFHHD